VTLCFSKIIELPEQRSKRSFFLQNLLFGWPKRLNIPKILEKCSQRLENLPMRDDDFKQLSDDQLWAQLASAENEEKIDILLELSDRSSKQGDQIRAASFAEQAAMEAESCMSKTVVEKARYRQGLALYRADRNQEAIDAFQLGVSQFEEPNRRIELSRNQWGIAAALYDLDEFPDAARWAQRATESALSEEYFSMAGLTKFLEAKALYMNDQEEEALKACEEARSYRRIEEQLDEVASIDAYMASIYSYLGNYTEAANLLRNCLVLAEATSSNSIQYYSYRLGNALIDLGEYREARGFLETARVLYQGVEDHSSAADCFFSLSLTYRGEENLDEALKLTRSAASLWDALGNNAAYMKGLQRIAILLFSKGLYMESIEVNRRIMSICKDSENESDIDRYGWALLRVADCYQAQNFWELALAELENTNLFALERKHAGKNWYYSLKAKSLFALDRHEEALGVAETALSGIDNDEVNSQIAHLYEIKARVSLEQNRHDKERHLAHAIALLLAFGETEKARELSEYFKPDFSPQKSDNILTDEPVDDLRMDRSKSAPLPGFGFAPSS